MDRSFIEQQICEAFKGLTLGGGVSLGQAQVADRCGDGLTCAQLSVLAPSEITDDWTEVPTSDLDSDCVAHLDAEGLRYYLAPLMLGVLEHYEAGSMRVIGTIAALDPRSAYGETRFALLSDEQRSAVACFLETLPAFVNLGTEDAKVVSRSLRSYWQRYL